MRQSNWLLAMVACCGFALLTSAGLMAGCSEDDKGDKGTLRVTVYGEPFIEEGIEAEEMADGWAIQFQRFSVEVSEVRWTNTSLKGQGGIDLSKSSNGAGHLLGELSVPAGTYAAPSFTLGSIMVEGTASKEGVTKTFSWTFPGPVMYTNCQVSTEVPADGVGKLELTIHSDHLFYDSLASEEPSLRFDAIAAADTDGDHKITLDELGAADIGAYDPGSLGINNLRAYVEAAARGLGHVDGEGHCD